MARKKASPTQCEKARQRREQMRALAKQIAEMSPAERQRLVGSGVRTIEGRSLSVHNSLMIINQLQGASVVGGFRQWRQAGRVVRKGEHGAGIWIPLLPKKDTDAETTPDDVHFRLATVFDISQTEELPVS